MMISEISSFKSNHAKRQDRNEDIFQPNEGNSESTPTPKGDGFFYKRRRLSRVGVAVLREEKPRDQSSHFILAPKKCTNSTSSLPSKSSKSAPVHIACKKLCLSILNDNAPLGDGGKRISSRTFNKDDDDKIRIEASLPCKACGVFEKSLNMLICDWCEAAYHLSCCNTGTKILGKDEDWFNWHCLPCSMSKQAMQSSWEFCETSGDSRKNILKNPIQAMLVDKRSYRSAVRVGKDFQAHVPEWSGPVNNDSNDYFLKPKELNVTDDSTSKFWCDRPRSRSSGNWVQCQEIIHASDNDEVTICGKWRRVPFEVVQTNDWDCSCLLPHDPFHADCAVPQEAENEEVIKQLKVLETARQLLENHTKKS